MLLFPPLRWSIFGWILSKLARLLGGFGESKTPEHVVCEDWDQLGYYTMPAEQAIPEHVNTVEDFQQWLDDLQFMNEM